MRLMELFESKIPQYNLLQKYKMFNRQYFENKLPIIPLSWYPLKNEGGKVMYKINRPSRTSYDNATLVPNTLKLVMSYTYVKSEQQLDAILLHEMIHVYFVMIEKFNVDHGPEFLNMAKQIGQKAGFEIPLTDKIVSTLAVDNKEVLVLLNAKKDNTYNFALFSPNVLSTILPIIQTRHPYFVNNGYFENVGLFKIKSPLWTQASYIVPVQRKYGSNTTYYKLPSPEHLEDLTNNATMVWKYPE